MTYRRIFLIVLDSVGAGAMPDAANYGDAGADTLGHISQAVEKLSLPNLRKLGLGNLHPMDKVAPTERPLARYGKLRERSAGKDTMTGHWEMMGLLTTEPFQTFTDTGFPPELIRELERRTGREIIGNKAASGTEILEELGEEEVERGKLIVYTSADSVLQICGNEETMGLETLYRYCEQARELTLRPQWRVGRVIARPYVGRKRGEFKRTSNRRDYALAPPAPTVLDALQQAGLEVTGVGKIGDIFSGQGLTRWLHSDSSVQGMEQTIALAGEDFTGLCFVNLVDFDALWGHRRDPQGYARELEAFDRNLAPLMAALGEGDLLLLTADHGNDPTYTGTDHTREKVPLLAWSPGRDLAGPLPEQDTFGVLGATIAVNFGVPLPPGAIGAPLARLLQV